MSQLGHYVNRRNVQAAVSQVWPIFFGGHAGRPSVPRETRELIRILSRNNSTQLAESLHRLKLALHHRYERVA